MRFTHATVKRRLETSILKTEGVQGFGDDNRYPQDIRNILSSSGYASACVNLFAKFIEGRGFEDEQYYKAVLNRYGLTTDKLYRAAVKDYSKHYGVAIHINYNELGMMAEANILPFEHCRLAVMDDKGYVGKIAVYDDWGRYNKKRINTKDIDFIDVFNPDPAVVLEQIEYAEGINNYKGQVYWFSTNGEGYPLAPCDPVVEDIETDSQIKIYKFTNITTRFMASHMMVTKGKYEDGSTTRDDNARVLEEFQGAENNAKIFHVEVENEEQVPIITPFVNENVDRLFEYHETSGHDNIRKNYGCPPVLIGDLTAGKMATSGEIKDATNYYNYVNDSHRRTMSEIFKHVFEPWGINTSGNWNILPLANIEQEQTVDIVNILADMSKNERRDLVGLPEEQTLAAEKPILATLLGVGGMQGLITILTDPSLTPQQKINSIIVAFPITKAEAEAMVNGTPLTDAN